MEPENRDLSTRIGPIEVDWPRSFGYFGGTALAVTLGLIEPPLGIFIAAIPFLKMLNQPNSPRPSRIVAQVLEGAAKPVGGDSDSSIHVVRTPGTGTGSGLLSGVGREVGSIWTEARRIAQGDGNRRL